MKDIRYYYDASGRPVAIRAFTRTSSTANFTDTIYYLQTNLQGDNERTTGISRWFFNCSENTQRQTLNHWLLDKIPITAYNSTENQTERSDRHVCDLYRISNS